ncbi:hypothetical protein Q5752_005763 [Cryptotrichosporon argae]
MTLDEGLAEMLVGMGFSPNDARDAATRYAASNAEAAVTWLLSRASETQEQPPAYQHSPTTAETEHREFSSAFTTLGAGATPRARSPTLIDDDDDELRRAIEMSKAGDSPAAFGGSGGGGGGAGGAGERGVRASAPPPSPSRELGPFFGPSDKEDRDGKLAVVPAGNQNQNVNEDADVQRAIEESMMTASFHSLPDVPVAIPRLPDAPVAYYAPTRPSAALFIQALAAVPQLQGVFASADSIRAIPLEAERRLPAHAYAAPLARLAGLFAIQRDGDGDDARPAPAAAHAHSFADVDKDVRAICGGLDVHETGLPPIQAITTQWLVRLPAALAALGAADAGLFNTTLTGPHVPTQSHVLLTRDRAGPRDLHGALAHALWDGEGEGQAIRNLADVVVVVLRRFTGTSAAPWAIEQEVCLDRYLESNAQWAVHLRATQSVVKGEMERLREQAERLRTYESRDVARTLETVGRYLASKPSKDPLDAELAAELASKVDKVRTAIADKLAALDTDLANKQRAVDGLFDDPPPERQQHKYKLRSVLWHDGFTTPGRHQYAYVQRGDAWWRVQETDVTRVEWSDVAADTTGQFTDGGPYVLVYSRDGPRPGPSALTDAMDVDEQAGADAGEAGSGDAYGVADEGKQGEKDLIDMTDVEMA